MIGDMGGVPAWPVAWTTIVVPIAEPNFGMVGAFGVQSVERVTPGICDYLVTLSPDLVGGAGEGAPDFMVNVTAIGDLNVAGTARIGYVGPFAGFGIQQMRLRIVGPDLVTPLAEAAWIGVVLFSVWRKGPGNALG